MAEQCNDGFGLQRFVAAQAPVLDAVRRELRAGRKESHWMWFVFPQLRGLGSSEMARHYGIGDLAEAQAYLAHPVLGPRLLECTGLVNAVAGHSARAIFGEVDALKFRSCMTLFVQAGNDPERAVFRTALDRFFGGEGDVRTRELLG